MSRQKQVNSRVRKITRVGKTSLAVTLPIELIAELGWEEKQKGGGGKIRGGVIIRDWKR